MSEQEMISLECPHCHNELYQPLTWFKEKDFTCPICGSALTADNFVTTISALEEAMEASYGEMINGEAPAASGCGGCCSGKGGCSEGEGD